jgi:hypothetical protein
MTEDSAGEVRQRLRELERRVDHLEQETGHSLEERVFRDRMERVFGDYTLEVDERPMGGYKAIVTAPPDALHDILDTAYAIDGVGWEILEVIDGGSVRVLVQEGLANQKI